MSERQDGNAIEEQRSSITAVNSWNLRASASGRACQRSTAAIGAEQALQSPRTRSSAVVLWV